MKAQYLQTGSTINYRPDSDVRAGDIVVVNDLVGISRYDIKAGELGALAVSPAPVFIVEKGAAVAFAFGQTVFWDRANAKTVTAESTGIVKLGLCVSESLASDNHVSVKLTS